MLNIQLRTPPSESYDSYTCCVVINQGINGLSMTLGNNEFICGLINPSLIILIKHFMDHSIDVWMKIIIIIIDKSKLFLKDAACILNNMYW